MIWGGADVIVIEIKCIINVEGLNHPQTTHPTMEKLSSLKQVPDAKKGWGPLVYDTWDQRKKINLIGAAGKTCWAFLVLRMKTDEQ